MKKKKQKKKNKTVATLVVHAFNPSNPGPRADGCVTSKKAWSRERERE